MPDDTKTQSDQFESAGQSGRTGIVSEFTDFLLTNKKWWLTPIIVVMLLVGVLVVFGGGAAAPFIYTLF